MKIDKEEIKTTVDNHMELDESVINDENAYMQITKPNGETIEIKINEAPVKEKEDGTKEFVFSFDFAAKEMTDEVTAQIVSGDGSVGTEYTYSVTDFVEKILEDSTGDYEEEKTLVKSMLNFGAMAQEYFGYNTDNLANDKLNEKDKVIAEAPDLSQHSYKEGVGELKGITYEGSALVLLSDFGIRHFFTIDTGDDVGKLTFTIDGERVYPELSDYGWYVELDGISIYDLDKESVLKITDQEGKEYSLTYSALSYVNTVNSKVASEISDGLKELVNSIYNYHETAKNYAR